MATSGPLEVRHSRMLLAGIQVRTLVKTIIKVPRYPVACCKVVHFVSNFEFLQDAPSRESSFFRFRNPNTTGTIKSIWLTLGGAASRVPLPRHRSGSPGVERHEPQISFPIRRIFVGCCASAGKAVVRRIVASSQTRILILIGLILLLLTAYRLLPVSARG
jgi:hypothetical protein